MTLSDEQARRLLKLHCTGDVSGGKWSTVLALGRKGMIEIGSRRIIITAQGKRWCDANHQDVKL